MYQPPHFEMTDRAAMLDVMRTHALAQLVSSGSGGLIANPIPFIVREQGDTLILRAHLARANPQWKALAAGDEALVIFQALEHYISPSWYATKAETHKVVPTWNYIIVQARGPVTVQDAADWKHAQVDALTSEHEQGRAEPWAVGDAPEPFVEAQMRGIVGIEMTVTSLTGKAKLSQNRSETDRAGVVAGLAGERDPAGPAMADLIAGRTKAI
jgi:transcriptional regulator